MGSSLDLWNCVVVWAAIRADSVFERVRVIVLVPRPRVENLHVSRVWASGCGFTERVPPGEDGSGLAEHSIDCKGSAADDRLRDGHPDIITAARLGDSGTVVATRRYPGCPLAPVCSTATAEGLSMRERVWT